MSNISDRRRAATSHQPSAVEISTNWTREWARVPEAWRTLIIRVDAREDLVALFVQNYRFRGRTIDFTPTGVPERIVQEVMWWLWLCGREGIRKIEPSTLKWCSRTLTTAVAGFRRDHGRDPDSITDMEVGALLRVALKGFEQRNGRLPSTYSRRNITYLVESMHLYLSVRCTDKSWWQHDIWDLRADARIPVREHEPFHDHNVVLSDIEPGWLREGVRFWLSTCLTGELLRWTSLSDRARGMARHLGPFLTSKAITSPVISSDRAVLRQTFRDYTAYLESQEGQSRPGKPLTQNAIDNARSRAQSFYAFMADNAEEAAAVTGDQRWAKLTDSHTRLWGPAFRPGRRKNTRELTWYSTADLQQMLNYLDVLAADLGHPVSITHPDGTISLVAGLGDPQAARTWLLQALTGRRASEILMLDFDPLEAIAGQKPPDPDDPDAFVAKLRYQQTKVDGVLPTILVEQAVVNVVTEQQDWLRARYPDVESKYLFLGLRHHNQGQLPRSYHSYGEKLRQLDKIHGLVDAAGHRLQFSQTHRLRHTRATELLNDGVPIHVVQRYLGHASPEMTLRYAATLEATAEAEFLKHKKIGASGADIGISPSDIYDMTQLSQRTDRVLPNGVCLLPPLKSCDKGNACLTCGHFATDATHLDELTDQRRKTLTLIDVRRRQYHERTGRELTDDNVWIHERRRELASLDAIINRLHAESEQIVAGAGTAQRLPLLQIKTRGSHESALRKADSSEPNDQRGQETK
ncbi:tyrosine-type recombinase/integrase [Gordonia otitidis]|nr:tyrosine-type recombinase/integrase [Gordonia otitidis]